MPNRATLSGPEDGSRLDSRLDRRFRQCGKLGGTRAPHRRLQLKRSRSQQSQRESWHVRPIPSWQRHRQRRSSLTVPFLKARLGSHFFLQHLNSVLLKVASARPELSRLQASSAACKEPRDATPTSELHFTGLKSRGHTTQGDAYMLLEHSFSILKPRVCG